MAATLSSTACPLAGDSTKVPLAAMLLPVVTCLSVSSGTAPASTTSCMLLKREPSFNSINVTSLESRRERTQPRKVVSLPTARPKACLMDACVGFIIWKYRITAEDVNSGGGSIKRLTGTDGGRLARKPLRKDGRPLCGQTIT